MAAVHIEVIVKDYNPRIPQKTYDNDQNLHSHKALERRCRWRHVTLPWDTAVWSYQHFTGFRLTMSNVKESENDVYFTDDFGDAQTILFTTA